MVIVLGISERLFSSIQSLSCVWLFATPWTAACQASLSITNSQSLLKLMSIEAEMPFNHLILCRPLLLSPSIFPSIWGFSNSHVWMWELDYKQSWARKNWCFWTVVLEKTLENPLDCKDIQPVHPKGNQSWIFIGRADAEAETPILWPPDVKNWLTEKTVMLGKIEGKRRRGWQRMDGWMASPTQWTWVWLHSRSWWWTGRPSVLQSMGSQRVGHDWATELNWGMTIQSFSPHIKPFIWNF